MTTTSSTESTQSKYFDKNSKVSIIIINILFFHVKIMTIFGVEMPFCFYVISYTDVSKLVRGVIRHRSFIVALTFNSLFRMMLPVVNHVVLQYPLVCMVYLL